MSLITRVLTTVATAVATYALATRLLERDRTPQRLANRLFIYSFSVGRDDSYDPNGVSKAAIATIAPGYFSIERDFEIEAYSLVTSAANNGKRWLLLRNAESGEMTIGVVDPDFTFRRVRVYRHGTYKPWTWATVDGRGYLMLTGMRSPKVGVAFAEVDQDGNFIEWWRTDLDIPVPREIYGLKEGHAWITNANGRGTVHIFDVKHGRMLSSRTFDREINAMIVDDDRVCLFTRERVISEVCVIDRNHQLVSVRYAEYDRDFGGVSFNLAAVRTPGAHLLFGRYPDAGTEATVRVFEPGGLRITKRFSQPPRPWLYVEPC